KMVAKGMRDHAAMILASYAFLGMSAAFVLGFLDFYGRGKSSMLWEIVFLVASALLASGISERLCAARNTSVSDMTTALLKTHLKVVESELQDYLRFYTTHEWRELRKQVSHRNGAICRKCQK